MRAKVIKWLKVAVAVLFVNTERAIMMPEQIQKMKKLSLQ